MAAARRSRERERGLLGWLVETVVLVVLAVALAQGIKEFVVQPFRIPSGSMISTIDIGDRVLADKMVYRFREPKAGEIVVADDPGGVYPAIIKRVVATEGQTVDLRDGRVVVDGQELLEPYTKGRPSKPQTVPMPVTLPPGHVWLMGDNRTGSTDSRTFGPIPVDTVRGRAFATYWPPTAAGSLE